MTLFKKKAEPSERHDELRRCQAKNIELEHALHMANDEHAKEVARLKRKLRQAHNEIRRLAALGETYHVGYDPRTEEVSCGNCGLILEGDCNYCQNCGCKVDYTVARDEDDWRYDAWRERDL